MRSRRAKPLPDSGRSVAERVETSVAIEFSVGPSPRWAAAAWVWRAVRVDRPELWKARVLSTLRATLQGRTRAGRLRGRRGGRLRERLQETRPAARPFERAAHFFDPRADD